MKLHCNKEYTSCMDCKTPSYKGFGLEQMIAGKSFDSNLSAIKSNYFIFILEGALEVKKDHEATVYFEKETLFFLSATSSYKMKTIKSGQCIYFSFLHKDIQICHSNLLNHYLSECNWYEKRLRPLKVNSFLSRFLKLLKEYLQHGINCRHLHEMKEKELMIIFRRTYSKEDLLTLLHPILGKDVNFKESIILLSDNFFNRTDLAKQLGMSVPDLSRKFKAEFNEPIHAWILKHKNARILEQVAVPSITIKDIIYEFNFSSSANFNRYCKKHFGCTPSELIKKQRLK